ncbi:MAG: RNA polymerase factor sigma-32 [Syntrophobacterales bacterium]|nr:RNA polymerase factor sigma-32 [Syntrophobacterales bacterium]
MKLPALTDTLEMYMAEINRVPLLSAEEEFDLAVKLKKYKNLKDAEKLVVANLRFVVKIAYEYKSYNVKLADLIQEGNIGLMHAVKKFDPHKGYRLISYAVWWIRAYIQNYIIRSWSMVKIGTTQAQRKLFFKLNKARKELEALSEKNPEFKEIAETLNVKTIDVEEMDLRLTNRDVSLNTSLNDESDATYLDFLTYQGNDQETDLIKKEEMEIVQKHISGAMEKLNEKEAFIVKNRIMADEPLTLQEVGDHYRITRERARQIEKQAIKKLQLALPYSQDEKLLLG